MRAKGGLEGLGWLMPRRGSEDSETTPPHLGGCRPLACGRDGLKTKALGDSGMMSVGTVAQSEPAAGIGGREQGPSGAAVEWQGNSTSYAQAEGLLVTLSSGEEEKGLCLLDHSDTRPAD